MDDIAVDGRVADKLRWETWLATQSIADLVCQLPDPGLNRVARVVALGFHIDNHGRALRSGFNVKADCAVTLPQRSVDDSHRYVGHQ